MALFINNPMTSLRISNSMNTGYSNLAKSIEKLSSGLKINSAADDPSQYASAARMRNDIASTQQGIRNANDAVSMLQTADGAMQVIDEHLVRMKELAEQAATGHYDSVQRMIIDSEYQQMASEITRIASATTFNGIHLLDGNVSGGDFTPTLFGDPTGALKLHYGTTNNSNKDFAVFSLDSMKAYDLDLGNGSDPTALGHNISTQEAASNALIGIDNAMEIKNQLRADIGAMQNRLELTVDSLEFKAESLLVSESDIMSTDVAMESTQLVVHQMQTQSATAMLVQANLTPSMVLDLLK